MRKLSIGVQSFEKLRNDGCIYVDKTDYIYKLANTGYEYFLSRPRRFGKSLLLSAMKSYFEGEKELFKGLAIEKLEEENENPWTEYPVIDLSFATGDYTNPEELPNKIEGFIGTYEKIYDVKSDKFTFGDRFLDLIKMIADKTGKNVVILIDEYDKPLLDNLGYDGKLEDKNRRTLKGFFGALKDGDPYIRFALITGVTKFSKVSLFSDLNNLEDISLDRNYNDIFGITENELISNYSDEINELAAEYNMDFTLCMGKLQQNYDGYHFSDKGNGLYNPFSLLNVLKKKSFGKYWFETGTPTYLINRMEKEGYNLQDISEGLKEDSQVMKANIEDIPDLASLLFQAGYLTISEYDNDSELYTLKFPNKEVEYGFEKALEPYIFRGYSSKRLMLLDKMKDDLDNGNADLFMQRLRALMASIPYPEGNVPYHEREWRNQVYLIIKLLGQRTQAEAHTSVGRVDCLIENKDYVYIFEFKQDKPVEDAIFQIDDNNYDLPYEADGRKVIKIGSTFIMEKRTFMEWKIE